METELLIIYDEISKSEKISKFVSSSEQKKKLRAVKNTTLIHSKFKCYLNESMLRQFESRSRHSGISKVNSEIYIFLYEWHIASKNTSSL
ncbi:hypothetical protein BpHYR1_009685 [Brachionus plicatilis]|uniref:Uncharacterized protein n=1 Tax=Brachionus plicatilis TaxID=10195 RepID=A0A3M7RJM2_BRAPC|nr:hypothetical protein BpHYR1_009685 [Brachionus plicatilis]